MNGVLAMTSASLPTSITRNITYAHCINGLCQETPFTWHVLPPVPLPVKSVKSVTHAPPLAKTYKVKIVILFPLLMFRWKHSSKSWHKLHSKHLVNINPQWERMPSGLFRYAYRINCVTYFFEIKCTTLAGREIKTPSQRWKTTGAKHIYLPLINHISIFYLVASMPRQTGVKCSEEWKVGNSN